MHTQTLNEAFQFTVYFQRKCSWQYWDLSSWVLTVPVVPKMHCGLNDCVEVNFSRKSSRQAYMLINTSCLLTYLLTYFQIPKLPSDHCLQPYALCAEERKSFIIPEIFPGFMRHQIARCTAPALLAYHAATYAFSMNSIRRAAAAASLPPTETNH